MKMTTFGTALAAALVMTGTAVGATGAPPVQEPEIPALDPADGDDGPGSLSAVCKKTYASGNGDTRFEWCFSNDGNVIHLEHSAGLEHVGVGLPEEGFCVSSDGVKRGQSFGALANIGLTEPSYPSATKVRHESLDGDLAIEQTFSQNTGTKTATVTMKLTNIGGAAQDDVYVTRWINAEMANAGNDDLFVAGARSVVAHEPGSVRLALLPDGTKYDANSMLFAGSLPALNQYCFDPAADAATDLSGDRSMGVLQHLGTIQPGASKTVKFHYQLSR